MHRNNVLGVSDLKLKQYVRYEMCFDGSFSGICVGFMALSFFLRACYYFGIVNLLDVNGGEVFFFMILPLLLCGAFIVFFKIMKLNAPGIYALFGCVFCILLMIWNFTTGDFLRIFLSLIFYTVAGCLLLATAGGHLPDKLPATVILAVILFFRFILYSMGQSSFAGYFLEFSFLSLIASMFALTFCFKPRIRSNERNRT